MIPELASVTTTDDSLIDSFKYQDYEKKNVLDEEGYQD
jgi:hypothetical protein